MSKLNAITFADNPAVTAAENPDQYVEITVSVPKILESWRLSLFSFEWLDGEGRIKPAENMPERERHKRMNAEKLIDDGQSLVKSILGIGLLDNVEIGSGRAEFLTLAARGATSLPVHIPRSNLKEFKKFLDKETERGNVLFYILIAIALLAALSYAVTQSGRGSVQSLNEDKVNLYTSEILEYANTITSAVSQLRLRGCKDMQISFENGVVSGYENLLAPTDKSCDIFDAKGGGVHWKTISSEMLADHSTLSSIKGQVDFTGAIEVSEVGSDVKADLGMQIDLLKKAVCMKINERLNIENETDNAPNEDLWNTQAPAKFQGIYTDGTRNVIGDDSPQFLGKSGGCRRSVENGEDAYFFYKVLLAR